MLFLRRLVRSVFPRFRAGTRRVRQLHSVGTVERFEPRVLLTVPGQVQLQEIEFVTSQSTGSSFPIAKFDAVDTADGYQFWVSYANVERVGYGTVNPQYENGLPKQMNVNLGDTAKFGVHYSTPGPGFQYWVWFRAYNGDGFGEWSVGRKFIIPNGERPGQPTLQLGSPSELLSTASIGYTSAQDPLDRALVTISTDLRAQVYDVEVHKNGVPVGGVYNTGIYGADYTTTWQVDNNGVYEFWVRARNGVGVSPWSYRAVVGIGTTPEITAPSGNSLASRPEFTWTRGAGGQNYELWVSSETSGLRVIHETRLTEQSYTPLVDLGNGIYKVWVREVTVNGYKLPWSKAVRFEVGTNTRLSAPVLSHVDNLTTGTDRDYKAVFNWTPIAGADHYELYLANPRDGSPYVNPRDLTGTTYTTVALEPFWSNYRVWIRAISSGGVAGDWSEPRMIHVFSDGRIDSDTP